MHLSHSTTSESFLLLVRHHTTDLRPTLMFQVDPVATVLNTSRISMTGTPLIALLPPRMTKMLRP